MMNDKNCKRLYYHGRIHACFIKKKLLNRALNCTVKDHVEWCHMMYCTLNLIVFFQYMYIFLFKTKASFALFPSSYQYLFYKHNIYLSLAKTVRFLKPFCSAKIRTCFYWNTISFSGSNVFVLTIFGTEKWILKVRKLWKRTILCYLYCCFWGKPYFGKQINSWNPLLWRNVITIAW